MVVILDTLSADDVLTYRALLDSLTHRQACGFLAGQEEITHWDAADLFQLYHDTLPCRAAWIRCPRLMIRLWSAPSI